MKLRAFVIMPFGTVRVDGHDPPLQIDFDRVYRELLEPALKEADCEPCRADSEIAAGDIRTDMFFELTTADIVVADLSVTNPNVYYELGIRDGVSPRGVFIVQGGLSTTRPFDVASDRNFKYAGRLFAADGSGTPADKHAEIAIEVDRLSKTFARAIATDVQVIGSPLYAHLPGLKPVDWECVETSRARHFGALQDDWQERVRTAQAQQRPGNIMTLAQDAPTRLHRTKILAHAARALIGLYRFAAAEEVLSEIVRLNPDDAEAQMELGFVLASLGDTQRAEHQMRSILQQNQDNPKAVATLGYVYRLLWYLQWKDDSNPRERARMSSRLLLSSIRSFYDVHRRHPEEYFCGYNALLLLEVLTHLFPNIQGAHPAPPFVNRSELSSVVRYVATAARENAEFTGEYETQFWSSVALSGLEMLAGNEEAALQGVRDACAVPSATLFFLRSFRERLQLLQALEFSPKVVSGAIEIVDDALRSLVRQHKWGNVLLFYGYPLDKPDQLPERFPSSNAAAVETMVERILDEWQVGKHDLAICSCATEGDIIFAEACLRLGAHVRLLLLEPSPGATLGFLNENWANRFSDLVEKCASDIWYHRRELGDPVDAAALKRRHSRWMVNTARMEAEGGTEHTRLYALLLWDGTLDSDNPEDPSFFISEIRTSNQYRGRVVTINPGKVSVETGMTAAV
jgi:hypothetical protein